MDETRRPSGSGQRSGKLLLKTWNDGEAALIRQLLATYGIPCQVVSDVPHTVLPISVDGLGEIRILVPASRLEEARDLLAAHRRQGMRVIKGGKVGRAERKDPRENTGGGGA